jgi:rhamnose transport system ATP-binding protein
MPVGAQALVDARAVSKRFGGVQALAGVSVSIAPGRVHGLVGENGAGKSTLAKIIGGVQQPDGGELLVDGEPVRFRSPRDALAAGIATIAQEIALVGARSVLENVFYGIEPRRAGVVRRRDLRRAWDALAERTGFGLDPDAPIRALRTADQQKAEILRAIARDARLILMDEPTAALTVDETDRLLAIVRRLAEGGTSVVLVSHDLEEVLSDTVTVMRDGQVVRTSPAADETPARLVSAMIGRDVDLSFPAKRAPAGDAPPVLEARGLARAGAIADVSLTLRAGEILGLAGLVGSGRTEVARALFGADRLDAGEVRVDGKPIRLRSPRDAARHGIALLPESRKDEGLLMIRSIAQNAALASYGDGDLATAGVVRRRRERARARELAARVDVRAPSVDAPVGSLSGGNQQKVLFAKWLARRPRILIADEPTRGVDVGAKAQIHDLIADLAAGGMAVLVISSELEEVLGLAHRVLVMRRGRVVAEYAGAGATREAVMNAAFATSASGEPT